MFSNDSQRALTKGGIKLWTRVAPIEGLFQTKSWLLLGWNSLASSLEDGGLGRANGTNQ